MRSAKELSEKDKIRLNIGYKGRVLKIGWHDPTPDGWKRIKETTGYAYITRATRKKYVANC